MNTMPSDSSLEDPGRRGSGRNLLVLGIDPGTYVTGIGAVEREDDDVCSLRMSAALRAPRSASLPERLAWLHERLERTIRELKPDCAAIETPFVSRNAKAALAVGQAQAAAMIAAAARGVPVALYTPGEVKKAVADHGGASKEQVREMARALLGMDEPPETTDAADAIAVAICHINGSLISEVEMWE